MCWRLTVVIAVFVFTACDGRASIPGDRAAGARSTTSTSSTTTTTALQSAEREPDGESAEASCPAVPERTQPDPQRPRYVVDADIDLDAGVVGGTLVVQFTPDLDTDRLVFRLWPNGLGVGARLQTSAVRLDGAEVDASSPDPATLVVHPPADVRAGTTVTASMLWRLDVPDDTGDRVSAGQGWMRLGTFLPLLAWEPGVGWTTDPPAGTFAEASSLPTADFDLTLQTDSPDVSVLASGVQDHPGHWTATAMRDVGLSVGNFRAATGEARAPDPVQVTVGVHGGVLGDPDRYLDQVVRVLEDFSRRFGSYPWPTLTLALTPGLPSSGIEYPSHIMQGSSTLGNITSHEIGHQWFYGLVGNNQGRHPWLDEALATYAENRAEGTLDELAEEFVFVRARGRAGEPMTFWARNPVLYQPGVYTQGAQAIAALGAPDLVDCALRRYAEMNANRLARPSDFIDAVNDVFPDAEERLAPYGLRP